MALSVAERQAVDTLRSKGLHPAREVNRAHILAALDDGMPDEQISQVLGVSRAVIWRARSAYQEKGLDYAVQDVPRPGPPRRYQAPEAAQVTALACTPPPPGGKRWTIGLLTAAARQHAPLHSVSTETIRRMLKKTS